MLTQATSKRGAGLRDAPLLYVFLETPDLNAQRSVIENGLHLPIIEVEPHLPHERHGAVKYDAGNIVLSLNISTPSRFREPGFDALTLTFSGQAPASLARMAYERGDGSLLTDQHGHRYLFVPGPKPLAGPSVIELRLAIHDLSTALAFYERLGLEVAECSPTSARLKTGTVDVVLEHPAIAPGYQLRRHTYLIVFHTNHIERAWRDLTLRGIVFKGGRPGESEIGKTIRLEDPAGNWLCLYEPSAECLTWGSGPKVLELSTRINRNREE